MAIPYDLHRSSRNDTVGKIKEAKMEWEYRLNGEIKMRKPERRSERNDNKMLLNITGVKVTEMPSLRRRASEIRLSLCPLRSYLQMKRYNPFGINRV